MSISGWAGEKHVKYTHEKLWCIICSHLNVSPESILRKTPEPEPHQHVSPKSDIFSIFKGVTSASCPFKGIVSVQAGSGFYGLFTLRFSCTSFKICSSRLDVSYSFSISYGLHGSAHFWACSIISGVKHKSKRIPLMLNLGRSQRLDHGFGLIFTFNYKRKRETDMKSFNLVAKHSRCTIYHYRMLQMRSVLLERLTGLTGTSPVIS